MGKIIFILGGTRSGKSSFAVEKAKKMGKNKVIFIATCIPKDKEMRKRIEIHKKSRPVLWETIELNPKSQALNRLDRARRGPKQIQNSKIKNQNDSLKFKIKKNGTMNNFLLINKLKKIKSDYKLIIIDCLTLLISNLLVIGFKEEMIEEEVKNLASLLLKAPFDSIIVSNEVGLGIVPENKLARQFRDIAGISNQIIAKYAEEVYFVAGGIPVEIK